MKKIVHRLPKYFFCVLPFALLLVFILLELSSRSAALIFNHVMEEQTMFRGTITVEKISANIMGEVDFEELLWLSPEGKTIVRIPSGSFQVDLWDVLCRNFSSTSLRQLRLKNAGFSLYLDENMQPDLIQSTSGFQKMEKGPPPDQKEATPFSRLSAEERKRRGEKRREEFQRELAEKLQNFRCEDRHINLRFVLEQCRIEVIHKNHHYLISSVNIEANIDTRKQIKFNVRTENFGGTMVGRGILMHGSIFMDAEPFPECDIAIMLKDVDPSSMGLGSDVHDKMTLYTYFDGPISSPFALGTVEMEELHIPSLDFQNVKGDVRYHESTLEFQDVTADVYGGKLTAQGVYDFDTRYYHIDGIGEDLLTKKALPDADLSCKVHLELSLESKGTAKETFVSGQFVSGPGSYQTWILFDRISGRFSNAYHDLRFYDVNIDLGEYLLSTDAFSIIEKKLTLSPIRLTDENGRLLMTYDPEAGKDPNRQAP